jgi:DNA-directed RNA polymerase subunit beta'
MMNALGTFMVGGNDFYTPMAQLRLKAGAYSREKANGQYETFIPTNGAQMTVWMDPAKGVFKVGLYSTNVSWYALVRALGASDDDIVKAFGNDSRARELLAANQMKNPESDIKKFFLAIFEKNINRDLVNAGLQKRDASLASVDYAGQVSAIRQWVGGQKVDPYVTKKTLGSAIDAVGKDLLLKSASRILNISRGAAEPDDRDALEFKKAMGVEDLMAERITKQGRMLKRKLLSRLAKPDVTLARGFGSDWLSPAVRGYFGGSGGIEGGLTNTAEAANPLAILGEQSKLTLVGEGGIGSDHAISLGARLFRPSSANFIDPSHTPEGSAIGVTTHTAINVKKKGTQLTAPFCKVTNGKMDPSKSVQLTVEEAADTVIGYPEYWDFKTGKPLENEVRANKHGEIQMVPASEVTHVIPSGSAMFDHTSNAALFLAHTHANRSMMAGKHISQALPLIHRELPLPEFKDTFGTDLLGAIAKRFTIRSQVDGTVEKITPEVIIISGVRHELYNRYPMQAKVALHHEPVVKVGDKVKKGQLIADSNYSRDGKLALGVNIHSAYMPWKNASNYEDAVVISESAAKKLSSEHSHHFELEKLEGVTIDKKLTLAQFPTRFPDGSALTKIGDDGIVKEGSVVKPGEPLIMAVNKAKFEEKDKSATNLSRIHKMLERPYRDATVYWTEIFPGTVYRVVRQADRVDVYIRTEEPMQVGDKISMSSAAKGTVSQIIPDDKMPHNKAGEPIEAIFNPLGVAGRINPSQTIEQAVGKLVRKGGKKYSFANFDGVNHAVEVNNALKKADLSHTEPLFDPETGKWLEKPVATGFNYVFKLDHPIRKKFSARGRDSYTMDETPTAGKGVGGQSYDQLTTYALLGHNAHAILGESVGVRGVKNDDFWRAYQAGETPPPPKVPFIFNKLETYLNAAGVDTHQHDGVMHFMPMTDKRVLERSGGKVERATLLKTRAGSSKSLAEEKGGLFDPSTTGGLFGDKWSHIELSERIPHPLYEKVVKDVTGIKTSDYYGLLGHTRHLDPKTGKFLDKRNANTLTGEEAFNHLLSFDPKGRLQEVKQKVITAVGSDRNKLNRAANYLQGLIDTKMKPSEAYMVKNVPVVPPKFRGITEMRDGSLRVADSNLLYRDVLLTNEQLHGAKSDGLPEDHLAQTRMAVYKSVGALVGVNNALTHRDDREDAKGFIDVIKGKNNKEGFFQRMVARRRNDYTGRSTIEPDANLGPDEIGIPEEMAWKIYEPAIVRRMSQAGWNPAEASKEVTKRSVAARNMLDAEMKERPVLYNRAPSLHRWSVMAGMPSITPGKEIKISPAVIGPYNADFDGDTMAVHVPITNQAKHESYGLLPTNNLWYDKNRGLAYGLEKDVVAGIFALTRPGQPSGLTFDTEEEAISAYQNNKSSLKMNSTVTIKGKGQQALGWILFQKIVPPRFLSGITQPVDGKKLNTVLERIAKESPGDYNVLSRRIAQAGFQYASAAGGITSTVGELAIDRTKIDRLLGQMDKEIRKAKNDQVAVRAAYDKYVPEIHKEIKDHLAKEDAGYHMFLESKPSGKVNIDQFTQMIASPILVTDIKDKIVPSVIRSAYGSGMSPSDFILTTPGARKGMVAKSLSTALPGFFAKEVAGNMGPIRIKEKDCGTETGVDLKLEPELKNHDADLLDRHLLHDIPGTGYKRNDVVTPEMLGRLRDLRKTEIWVRSPMTCQAKSPPCQMCAGRSPEGKLWAIGSNIGYNYGQAISEPSTQLTMKIFHSGGTLGSGDKLLSGFARLKELLSAPETIRDQGTLADVTGTVRSIRMAPQGGWYVVISPANGSANVEQHIMAGRTLKVKTGDKVSIGDPLSDGSYRPQEIAAKKSMLQAQKYVVNEARKSYQDAGVTVRKPVLEVLAAGMMRYVEITNDGGEPGLTAGDVIHENKYQELRKHNPKITAVPTVLGLSAKPLLSKDLFERLGFQRLEDAVREIPAIGGKADLTGSESPLAGIAYGAKFRPQGK